MSRSLGDLEARAVKFWPDSLTDRSQQSSVIPRLIDSQEKFIGILYVADSSPTSWISVLDATSGMAGNLFLKHLMVLTDIGGELLQCIGREIENFFPERVMSFIWRGSRCSYRFQSLSTDMKWTNRNLAVDGTRLVNAEQLTREMQDVAMVLLHGGAATNLDRPDDVFQRCCIGTMLGNKSELDTFVRQRYIHVSRITGGATANTMGQLARRIRQADTEITGGATANTMDQLAQSYVRECLKCCLHGWDFSRTRISGISQNVVTFRDTELDALAEYLREFGAGH